MKLCMQLTPSAGARAASLGLIVALLVGATPLTTVVWADAALFADTCVKCHARAATLARSLKGASAAEKSEALDKFLAQHHAADAAARARLVAYLVGLAPK